MFNDLGKCLLSDITLDSDGDYVLDTEFVPMVV